VPNYNGCVYPNWPLRWPAEWRDPGALDLVKGTPLGCLVFPSTEGRGSVIERAGQLGLPTCATGHPPPGVEMVKGEWPGVRMAHGEGDASSGPTGAPWIDSNGWLVRLTHAKSPDSTVWVAGDPPKSNEIVPLSSHLVAVADSAAHGGRWVVTLDKALAEGLAARQARFVEGWKRLMNAIRFFESREEWSTWPADAVLGVVSSFAGDNEFFSGEVLNLMARTNVSYGILMKSRLQPDALRRLRAVLYPDADPPAPQLRQALLEFAERGGLLITGPKWGAAPGTALPDQPCVRYEIRRFGRGRIAMAYKQPDDPYEVAQDAQIIVSHRYDLVHLFNSFLLGAYSTVSPDRRRRLTHVINYGGFVGADPPTARIAGRFRSAKLWSFERPQPEPLKLAVQKDAVEVHLPPLAVYGAIELEAAEHA